MLETVLFFRCTNFAVDVHTVVVAASSIVGKKSSQVTGFVSFMYYLQLLIQLGTDFTHIHAHTHTYTHTFFSYLASFGM